VSCLDSQRRGKIIGVWKDWDGGVMANNSDRVVSSAADRVVVGRDAFILVLFLCVA